jgi:predicted alpha/beta-hydrolase family hydrolase
MPELVEAARAVPSVVVQGTRDSLGSPGEIAVGLAEADVTARVVPIWAADHSFRVPSRAQTTTEEALDMVVRAARSTALRIVDGRY